MHENNGHQLEKSIVISLCFGGFAGCIAKSTIAPLDRAKINFQTTNYPFTFRALTVFIKDTYKQHGMRYLWRGNSATLTRVFPYAGIQYTANEMYKMFFNVPNCQVKISENTWCNQKMFLNFVSGSLAGLTSVSLTYPLDIARARMAVTSEIKYRNIFHLMKIMVKEEGVASLYKGITPTLFGVVPYSGIGFLVYETIRDLAGDDDRKLSMTGSLVSGGCAGILAQFVCYPLDIVRRRMQTAYVRGSTDYTKLSVRSCLSFIKQSEGLVGGLFKGFSLNLIKTPTASAISFTVYHSLCDYFDVQLNRK